MAKAPASISTREADVVAQWKDITLQFIRDIAAYAASDESDPVTASNIREMRVMTQSFLAALQSVQ